MRRTDPPASGPPMTMPPAGPLPRQAIEVDVHASVVRPGDKLVIATSRILDQHDADLIRSRLGDKLPGVEVLVVQADALVVYRP